MNINPNEFYNIPNNTVYEIYYVATTKGGIINHKIFRLKVSLPPVNLAPGFKDKLENYKLMIKADEQITGLEEPFFIRALPLIEDKEGDEPIVKITTTKRPACGCIILK